ncbi:MULTISPECIES: hypothetical protein [Streptomyces]|uniref:hypothetical protein n=1 Tax=Streptomyces TaxID=1883 RepID=UPI00240DB730|nr:MULTISPECIES: hypothetical protein [Streptomyces]WFB88367.1 hypothetical protein MMU79_36530 [Streptomyces olivaceus]WGK50809.1 hypothetical protein M6G09_37270 [Streptomyces sp. B146]
MFQDPIGAPATADNPTAGVLRDAVYWTATANGDTHTSPPGHGVRLDTEEDRESCGNVTHLRRARRARVGADIDRELPGLADGERRHVIEERLRERVAIEAEDLAWRQEQARVERARREAVRAAAAEQVERERQAAAAADAVRQALACEHRR